VGEERGTEHEETKTSMCRRQYGTKDTEVGSVKFKDGYGKGGDEKIKEHWETDEKTFRELRGVRDRGLLQKWWKRCGFGGPGARQEVQKTRRWGRA